MLKTSKQPTAQRSAKVKTPKKVANAKRALRLKPAVLAASVLAPSSQAKLSAKRSGSKQAMVLSMLRRAAGASVASIMTATGWQQHSVRGFFAGVVRKKLKLILTSGASEDGRIYKITDQGGVAAGAITSTRAAA